MFWNILGELLIAIGARKRNDHLGACLIAGIRLARATHVNHRRIPTSDAINESVDLAHEIYNRVFRRVPERLAEKAEV